MKVYISGRDDVINGEIIYSDDKGRYVNRKVTNADLIRTMSDEELSELLYEAQMSVLNEMCPNKYIVEDTWLEWLQQEIDENE